MTIELIGLLSGITLLLNIDSTTTDSTAKQSQLKVQTRKNFKFRKR